MSKQKGTFNAGWWNCFSNFSSELLSINPNADNICRNVLSAAGITVREAAWQLEHGDHPEDVTRVIHEYWLSL